MAAVLVSQFMFANWSSSLPQRSASLSVYRVSYPAIRSDCLLFIDPKISRIAPALQYSWNRLYTDCLCLGSISNLIGGRKVCRDFYWLKGIDSMHPCDLSQRKKCETSSHFPVLPLSAAPELRVRVVIYTEIPPSERIKHRASVTSRPWSVATRLWLLFCHCVHTNNMVARNGNM